MRSGASPVSSVKRVASRFCLCHVVVCCLVLLVCLAGSHGILVDRVSLAFGLGMEDTSGCVGCILDLLCRFGRELVVRCRMSLENYPLFHPRQAYGIT